MTPESRKMFNTYMGSFLIFLALVCFGLAAYMIFVPAAEKPAPLPTVAAISKQPCIEGLTALGFTAISVGDDIQVSDRHTDIPPLERLKAASLGVSMCHLYLKNFCMGPECADPTALSFTLTTNEAAATSGSGQRPAAPKETTQPVTPAAQNGAPDSATVPGLPPEPPPHG